MYDLLPFNSCEVALFEIFAYAGYFYAVHQNIGLLKKFIVGYFFKKNFRHQQFF